MLLRIEEFDMSSSYKDEHLTLISFFKDVVVEEVEIVTLAIAVQYVNCCSRIV